LAKPFKGSAFVRCIALTYAHRRMALSELAETLAPYGVNAGILKGHLWRMQIAIDPDGRLRLPPNVRPVRPYYVMNNQPRHSDVPVPQGAA
jgi:hypothetical protein